MKLTPNSPEYFVWVRVMNSIENPEELTKSVITLAKAINYPNPPEHVSVEYIDSAKWSM